MGVAPFILGDTFTAGELWYEKEKIALQELADSVNSNSFFLA
jgi:hypothetical protein